MKDSEIIRAWKDPIFRQSLTGEQADILLAHPSADNQISEQLLLGNPETGSHMGTPMCTPCPPRYCY